MKPAPGTHIARVLGAILSILSIAACIATPPECRGQAWTPPRGDGSVTFSYQWIDNTGHRLTDGTYINGGRSVDTSLYIEGEYAFTSRLSITAGLPWVAAKYTDANPPPPPIPYLPVDQCHCWQTGVTDFGATARYNLLGGRAYALTPSIAVTVPTHDYNYRGEAALGRDLREMRIGMDAGWRVDPISRNLSVDGHYTYAFVERAISDLPDNRSNVSVEGVYLFKRRLAIRGVSAWQRTHGGLRLGSMPPAALVFPGEVDTPDLLEQHDRLLRDNNWRAGGGLAYSFDSVDLFASYLAYISGTDTHTGGALTVGFSLPFHLGGPHK